MAASRRLPVVVIMGATGTGKSKLALEIGQLFKGEIISADSMQIYKGLDIITNKVTAEERKLCPHHMIDYLSPLQEHNTIVEFRDATIPIIDRILQDGKLPIVCGGTTYYIESLLWNFLINSQDVLNAKKSESVNLKSEASATEKTVEVSEKAVNFGNDDPKKQNLNECDPMASEPVLKSDEQGTTHHLGNSEGDQLLEDAISSDTESESEPEFRKNLTLHERLQNIDPETAKTIHPNDRRKILRALEVYEQHGIPMSEILRAQKSGEGDLAKSGPLRYPHTCLFWIQCDREVMDERINKRADKMIEEGLVEELLDFHHQYNVSRMKENREVDYTLGIFQSIGFKEFHEYLILSPEERDTEEGKQLLEEGIEGLKWATRKYARKQISRINGRFLKRPGVNVPPVYGLDATDVSLWEENVYKPALSILTDIMEGREPSIKPLPYNSEEVDLHVYRICEACNKVLVNESQMKAHFRSKKHHKRIKSLKKREKHEKENPKNREPKESKESEESLTDDDDDDDDDDGMLGGILRENDDTETDNTAKMK